MLTNELKKGDKVILTNGWKADIVDNGKGNIRYAKVYGFYTETGSIYAWDIDYKVNSITGELVKIELTEKQKKDRARAEGMGL